MTTNEKLFVTGLFLAAAVIDEYRLRKLKREYEKVMELAIEGAELLEADSNANEYLLSLLNKYEVPFDEFEEIALKYHQINLVPVEEGD